MARARFGRYSFELSNRDKVLFPRAGVTKGALVDYYAEIADCMLPQARGRPLTLQRYPDGIHKEGFYQQRRSEHFPDWIDTVTVERASGRGKPVEHVVCNKQATLAYLANQGAITLHGWLSRTPRLQRPDRIIFDLDPVGDDFSTVVTAARRVAALMDDIGLTPYVMTTGSRGVHVVAPIRPTELFEDVRGLARDMAEHLADRHGDELTTEQRRNKRRGRLYLDIMRNAYGQTAVLPYAVRAKPHGPVATPLDWDELGRKGMHAQRYTLANIRRRVARKTDPWRDVNRHAAAVRTVRRALVRRAAGDAEDMADKSRDSG